VNAAEPRYRTFYADAVDGRNARPRRAWLRMWTAGILVSMGALAILLTGIATAFRVRRLYAAGATVLGRVVLRLYDITLRVHGAPPWPTGQTVYVSNHTSTLDVFILVALGLPETRFFLSGFLRRIPPVGLIASMMGTFFTVPQTRPAERTLIFRRAEAALRATGESVYLSPEGQRVTGGRIGHFNKGAFHLATNLGAPIVPIYIHTPPAVDPGRGFDARPGVVDVFVLDALDTTAWRLADLEANVARVRNLFVTIQEERLCA
jgi:1-acyl-sn-glycerol-3-phosphate acyltransferase